MRRTRSTDDDRGQAFTLEGFIGAIVVLTAVLFALQAVVITPTTGGTVDRGAQAQFEQEVKDTLLVAENEEQLSKLVRYFDNSSDEWQNKSPDRDDAPYSSEHFANQSNFGEILDEHFVNSSGNSYNVEYIVYNASQDRVAEDIVKMGGGRSDGAVSASYTVTLYEEQRLTEPNGDGPENNESAPKLREAYEEGEYPIPPYDADEDHPVYNVVEVRVTVW